MYHACYVAEIYISLCHKIPTSNFHNEGMDFLVHFPKIYSPVFPSYLLQLTIAMPWSARVQTGAVLSVSTCIIMLKASRKPFCTKLQCVYIPSEHWENQFSNLIRVGQTNTTVSLFRAQKKLPE